VPGERREVPRLLAELGHLGRGPDDQRVRVGGDVEREHGLSAARAFRDRRARSDARVARERAREADGPFGAPTHPIGGESQQNRVCDAQM
jgi:hypothetical protein